MKHLKTYETLYLYGEPVNIYDEGDIVKVKFTGYDKLKEKEDIWFYNIKILDNDIDNQKIRYYGQYFPDESDEVIVFYGDDIVKKLSDDEVKFLKDTKKYNL